MNRFAVAAIVAMFAGLPAFAAEGVSMPSWPAAERAEFKAGGGVLGGELFTRDPEVMPMAVMPPQAGEIHDAADRLNPVPAKFFDAYFAERPKTFLVDPQQLLSPEEAKERLSFLKDHSADSAIDLFVFVVGADQEIPSEVRQEELMERLFSTGRPAVLAIYHYGAPERTVLELSPSLMGPVMVAEQRRALESSVMQASEKSEPAAQLEKFLVQMSIHLYWMERLTVPQPVSANAGMLTREGFRKPVKSDHKSEKLEMIKGLATPFVMPAAILLAVLSTLWLISRWLGFRARYQFRDFEVEPRLGGPHAAGIGAVISFASASLPPASQRDQLPDYLRRI